MSALSSDTPTIAARHSRAGSGLGILLCFHIVMCCVSLSYVADYYSYLQILSFDQTRLYAAALIVAPFAVAAALFTYGRFSFGYVLGFYFYTMILGYLWIVEFSKFHYDHTLTAVSAFASGLAFLVPALFITAPIRQWFVLSPRVLDNLLSLILILAAAVIVSGAFYNFRLVGFVDIDSIRDEFEFPGWLRYAIGATSNALLPFAFACFVARGSRWRAAAVLLLLLLFYPITLSKMALLAPFWLLFLAALSRFFEVRIAVVLSLFLPLLAGILLMLLYKSEVLSHEQIHHFFGAFNFRLIAFPSIALDVYNDFFSTHPVTHFCQIVFLKPFVSCPYNEFLSVMMARTYRLGNLNGSLFATEGIASVGPMLAPLAALACGLVISLANRLSAGLPPGFILLSGGMLTQVFLNVPLTTTLLSNGAALLFLLWYVTPRAVFEHKTDTPIAAAN